MRTILFGVVLSLVILALPPSMYAARGTIVGCRGQGYTMQIPASRTLQIVANCTPSAVFLLDRGKAGYMILGAGVSYQAWWSDARSRSSLTNDITAAGKRQQHLPHRVVFSVRTYNRHRFVLGIGQFDGAHGVKRTMVEIETFYTGYLYTFYAFIPMLDSASSRRLQRVWATIHLYPRAAPAKRLPSPAILGAPQADWLRSYGTPMLNTGADEIGWLPCANHITAGLLVQFVQGRAFVITRQHCDEDAVLSVAQRRSLAARFMPRDAVPHGGGVTSNYTIWRYTSASLAHEAPHLGYWDCNGNDVAPGTFVFDISTIGDDGTWSLTTGTCGA